MSEDLSAFAYRLFRAARDAGVPKDQSKNQVIADRLSDAGVPTSPETVKTWFAAQAFPDDDQMVILSGWLGIMR